jgi:hypothetical protein
MASGHIWHREKIIERENIFIAKILDVIFVFYGASLKSRRKAISLLSKIDKDESREY